MLSVRFILISIEFQNLALDLYRELIRSDVDYVWHYVVSLFGVSSMPTSEENLEVQSSNESILNCELQFSFESDSSCIYLHNASNEQFKPVSLASSNIGLNGAAFYPSLANIIQLLNETVS
jgi:hypothetical protein